VADSSHSRQLPRGLNIRAEGPAQLRALPVITHSVHWRDVLIYFR
jgi:hypothetical protein